MYQSVNFGLYADRILPPRRRSLKTVKETGCWRGRIELYNVLAAQDHSPWRVVLRNRSSIVLMAESILG